MRCIHPCCVDDESVSIFDCIFPAAICQSVFFFDYPVRCLHASVLEFNSILLCFLKLQGRLMAAAGIPVGGGHAKVKDTIAEEVQAIFTTFLQEYGWTL